MADNVVFLRITNPAGKTAERGFEVNTDGVVLNPANHNPMYFAERPDEPIRISEACVVVVNDSDKFAVEQFQAGECASIDAGRKQFYAKRDEAKKTERDAENAFLRSKGFRWEKRSLYNSGPGEMQDRWLLLDPNGNIVVGYKDGGFDLLPFGDVKSILTDLGYYGQDAVDKKQSDKAEAAERMRMRSEVDGYFQSMPSQKPVNFSSEVPPVQIESFMPRRQFRILGDSLVLESHNTGDGDDWSLNNCDYGIATVFPFDPEIADYLRQLAT